MGDMGRLRGILPVAFLLSACLADCQATFAGFRAWWPTWLRNDWAAVEYTAYEEVGPQVAGLVRTGHAYAGSINVLLGASYQSYGIDLSSLEAEVRPHRRWLRLTAYFGATPCELEQLAQLLLIKGHVKPATVVVTLGLRMLARPDDFRRLDISDTHGVPLWDVVDQLRGMHFIRTANDLEVLAANAFNTVFRDRTRINCRLGSRLTRVRVELFDRCGQPLTAAFAPAADPWDVPLPPVAQESRSYEGVVRNLNLIRGQGRLDAAQFSPLRESSRSLVNLIGLVRSAGCEIVIVLMPERSITRAALPPEARRTFLTLLKHSFGEDAPRVIDLESFLPDEDFLDLAHANGQGRAKVTRRLVDELNGEKSSRLDPSLGWTRSVLRVGGVRDAPTPR